MAKKDLKKATPNVVEQLKKFNANIADEEIIDTPAPKQYNFKKKDHTLVDQLIISEVPNIPHVKISKEALLQLVKSLPTLQEGLKRDISFDIENDIDSQQIRDKILQVQTFDLRIINEILINI